MLLIVGGFAWVLFLRGDGKPDNGGEFEGEPLESAVTVLEPPAEGAVDSVNCVPASDSTIRAAQALRSRGARRFTAT